MSMKSKVVLAAVLLAAQTYAVPAYRGGIAEIGEDGKEHMVFLRGDEYGHWNEDADGYTLVRDERRGRWVYARGETNGTLIATDVALGSSRKASAGFKRGEHTVLHPRILERRQAFERSRAEERSARIRRTGGGALRTVPNLSVAGKRCNLCILVSFSDEKIKHSKAEFLDLFNKTGYSSDGAKGSFRDFYKEVSYGKLDFETEVVGPVTVSQTYSYYGKDVNGNDANPRQMVEEALELVHKSGFDFSTCDVDGDGELDGLCIIHAGFGQEMNGNPASCIWSHQWSLASAKTYDGVRISLYHTEPDMRGLVNYSSTHGITRVGTICHETGHFLGLPDLYDYGGDSGGLGMFCLMSGGSWGGSDGGEQPTHMSAWCKTYLGWIVPDEISRAGSYSLPCIEKNAKLFKLQGNLPANEYFLVENRQGHGFDAATPGAKRGLLIYHVDDKAWYGLASSGRINDNQNHYMVDLEEASGTQHLQASRNTDGDDSDYFRSGTKTSFTSSTSPNNLGYSGTALGLDISSISASGDSMTFSVAGSDSGSEITVVFNPCKGSVSPSSKKYSEGAVLGSLPTPTRTGYSFQGWYTQETGGTSVSATTKASSKVPTIFAHWQANTYTVSFDANGGSGKAPSAMTFTYDVAKELPANTFAKDGWSFLGWAKDRSATAASWRPGEKVSNLTAAAGGKVVVYAVWRKDPVAQSLSVSGPTSLFGGESASYVVTARFDDGTSSVVVPTWEAITGDGSTLSADGKLTAVLTRAELTTSWRATHGGTSVRLDVRVMPKTVTVVFDPDGGQLPDDRRDYIVGFPYGDLPVSVGPYDRVFAGWKTEGGKVVGVDTPAAADVTRLRASWRMVEASDALGSSGLSFRDNGTKKWTVVASPAYEGDSAMRSPTLSGTGTASLETTVRGGGVLGFAWRLGSYAARVDCCLDNARAASLFYLPAGDEPMTRDVWYVRKIAVPDGTHTVRWTVSCENVGGTGAYAYLDGVTWEPGAFLPGEEDPAVGFTVTVKFDAQGGSVTPAQGKFKSGLAYGELPDPVREGWTFAGWFSDAGFQVTEDSLVPAADAVLHARWVQAVRTVTVSFDATGGTVSPASRTYTVGAAYGGFPVPVRQGFDFLCWQTRGNVPVFASDEVAEDVTTLYASWEKLPDVDPDIDDGSFNLVYFPVAEGEPGFYLSSDVAGYKRCSSFAAGQTVYLNYAYAEETGRKVAGLPKTCFKMDGNTLVATDGELQANAVNMRTGYAWTALQGLKEGTYRVSCELNADGLAGETDIEDNQAEVTFTVGSERDVRITVTFDANGGTVSPAAGTFIIGAVYGSLPIPKPPSATKCFVGWYADRTYGTPIAADDTVRADVVRLYARWSDNQYRLTYNANGGTGTMEDQFFTRDTWQKLRKNAFANGSHTFLGWANGAGARQPDFQDGSECKFSTDMDEWTINLYAVWSDGPDFAKGLFNTAQRFTGGEGWTYHPYDAKDYNDYLKSTGDSGSFETEVEGPGTLRFGWKVLSSGMRMEVSVDGTPKGVYTAPNANWTKDSLTVPSGTHTVRWSYVRQSGTGSVGVNMVEWTGPQIVEFKLSADWANANPYDGYGTPVIICGSPVRIGCKATYDNGIVKDYRPGWLCTDWNGKALPPSMPCRTLDDGRLTVGTPDTDLSRALGISPEYHVDNGSFSWSSLLADAIPFCQAFSLATNGATTAILKQALLRRRVPDELELPDSITGLELTRIAPDAFGPALSNLTLTVSEGNVHFSVRGGVLYGNDGTVLIRVQPGFSESDFRIPDGVTDVSPAAFADCAVIRSLTIPSSVRTIGAFAFARCRNLSVVRCAGDAPEAGEGVFSGCAARAVCVVSGSLGWGTRWAGLEPTAWRIAVRLEACGGNVAPGTCSCTVGSCWDESLPVAVRDGFEFDGWWTAADGGARLFDGDLVSGDMDGLQLYAHWLSAPYDVVLHDGDGGSSTVRFRCGVRERLPACELVKVGHHLAGWAATAGGAAKYGPDEEVVDLAAADDRIDLYAVWEANTYVLRFGANGGDGRMDDSTCRYGTDLDLPECAFTRAGYSFAGWTTAVGTEVVYGDCERVPSMTSANDGCVMLHADWTPNAYRVSFRAVAGGAEIGTAEVTFGSSDPVDVAIPERRGFVFTGYFDDQGVQYFAPDLSAVREWDKPCDTVLIAGWRGVSWSVRFASEFGGGTMSDQTFEFGVAKALNANAFVFTGHVFAGWSRVPGGESDFVDGEEVADLADEEGAVVCLYAVWKPLSYTLSFDAGAGNGEMAPCACVYGKGQQLPPCTFVRTGYRFGGWSRVAGGAEEFADRDVVSNLTDVSGGEVVLHAVWKPITYRIVYEGNGGDGNMSDQDMTFGEATALGENLFVREGYSFAGWSVVGTDGSVRYADGEPVSDLVSEEDGSITLRAEWEANRYDVTFDGNGGKPAKQVVCETFDANYVLPDEPVRSGYAFAGWYDDKSEDGMAVDETVQMSMAKNHTLWAHWTKTYKVTVKGGEFENPGSSSSGSSGEVAAGATNLILRATGGAVRMPCSSVGRSIPRRPSLAERFRRFRRRPDSRCRR